MVYHGERMHCETDPPVCLGGFVQLLLAWKKAEAVYIVYFLMEGFSNPHFQPELDLTAKTVSHSPALSLAYSSSSSMGAYKERFM